MNQNILESYGGLKKSNVANTWFNNNYLSLHLLPEKGIFKIGEQISYEFLH